jgi:uncharacterized protein (TIGR03435 family)
MVFDIVSIKVSKNSQNWGMVDPPDGDGITITNWSLFDILRWNLNIHSFREDQLKGVPPWFTTERYDIQAKVADTDVAEWRKTNEGRRRLIFRKILVDRFKLATHFDNTEQPVYNLVLANPKNGPKFKEVKPGDPDPNIPKNPDGTSVTGADIQMIGPNKIAYHEIHMASFAKGLSGPAGRQVYDKTGLPLTSTYDFILEFNFMEGRMGPGGPDSPPPPEPTAPSLFTALQEQLGLKLEPAKAPVGQLVVDHVDHPSEE